MSEQAGGDGPKTFTEEIEVVGSQLTEWVGHLLKDKDVQRIRIKAPGGQLLFEAPKDRGLWGDGVMGLGPPWPGILGALAVMVARMTIEITRIGTSPDEKAARLWDNGNGGNDT